MNSVSHVYVLWPYKTPDAMPEKSAILVWSFFLGYFFLQEFFIDKLPLQIFFRLLPNLKHAHKMKKILAAVPWLCALHAKQFLFKIAGPPDSPIPTTSMPTDNKSSQSIVPNH